MDNRVILLREILSNPHITQRELKAATGIALGSVNTLLKENIAEGFIVRSEEGLCLSDKGRSYLSGHKVDGALILAAGFGSRFVPLSFEKPKGLLEVYGEPMIERQIKQLREKGINDIAIVVGYKKEQFEYLIDKYDVKLIYNEDYTRKNNISSIYAAREFLKCRSIYILSSDNWLRVNPFNTYEGGAWYSARFFAGDTREWQLITDKRGLIKEVIPGGKDCYAMYGPAFFHKSFMDKFLPVLIRAYSMPGTDDYYWEDIYRMMLSGEMAKRLKMYFGNIPELTLSLNPSMNIKIMAENEVYEFENLEELRAFDPKYIDDSGSKAMQLVSRVFKVPESEITHIRRLKKGMTNNSWLFYIGDDSYICRVPGEGTNMLINRAEEKKVYEAVEALGLTEKLIYFDENTGYKISEYYEGARNADFKNDLDLRLCMEKLASFHKSGVSVAHEFNIGDKISFYEELCGGAAEIPFNDYSLIVRDKDRLLKWLRGLDRPQVLAHIDPVCDNFIFVSSEGSSEKKSDIRLIDWEYSGMCDPFIDLGMCAIYSYMTESEALKSASYYLGREPNDLERNIIYAYMALGGLLWALWGVYKEKLGVEFSDYTLKMYRYFKIYSAKVLKK